MTTRAFITKDELNDLLGRDTTCQFLQDTRHDRVYFPLYVRRIESEREGVEFPVYREVEFERVTLTDDDGHTDQVWVLRTPLVVLSA